MVNLKNISWKDFNIFDVIQGCADYYLTDFNNKSDKVKKIVKYRYGICQSCHMNSNGWCDNSGDKKIINVKTNKEVTGCGCQLKCKTALLKSNCPAGLWESIEETK